MDYLEKRVTWFLVVLFMEWEEYPLYMFTNPTFQSQQECIESAKNPEDVKKYVVQLLNVYGRPMPVKGVVCINEQQKDKLLGKQQS
jgi:hypothetical protein